MHINHLCKSGRDKRVGRARVKQNPSLESTNKKCTFHNISSCLCISSVDRINLSSLLWPILSLLWPGLICIHVLLWRMLILILSLLTSLLLLLLRSVLLLWCLLLKGSSLVLHNHGILRLCWTLCPLLLLIMHVLPWVVPHLMGHGTTSETCSCDSTTLGTLMVLRTMCTH
jgi:hypothetical protein